jgi:excisionase family DNA binding protein
MSTTTASTATGPWLDSEAARVYLGLPTAKALRDQVRRGRIHAYRIGRLLRFSQSEIDNAIASGASCRTCFATSGEGDGSGE